MNSLFKQALLRKSAVPLGTRASCLEQSSALSQPLGQVHVRELQHACAGQRMPGSPDPHGRTKPAGKGTQGWSSPAQQQVSRTSKELLISSRLSASPAAFATLHEDRTSVTDVDSTWMVMEKGDPKDICACKKVVALQTCSPSKAQQEIRYRERKAFRFFLQSKFTTVLNLG